eukprot:TRINITY_DN6852_c0_g1_i1.p1 TRINITY_DN6852_c0_g1~~TRINITY_DN6852_c0_g1_i1.p1  ORF type:complete len:616 (+),score=126.74 TRINITY_DN6852_c0_g1_i1:168-2015(+)
MEVTRVVRSTPLGLIPGSSAAVDSLSCTRRCITSSLLLQPRAGACGNGITQTKVKLADGSLFKGRKIVRRSNALALMSSGGNLRCLALMPDTISDLATLAEHAHIVLGVGVGLPCTVMECGDVIYRSTLSPQDSFRLTSGGLAIFLGVMGYLWATPGVAPGFWDMFVLAPLEEKRSKKYKKDDFALGKKLGEGAYGTVYRAVLKDGQEGELVVKRANEFGAVEIWMNERVRRACANSCANFVTGFVDKSSRFKDEFWLVWKFEGNATLYEILNNKEFPYNVEESLFGGELDIPKGPERENEIIMAIMRQILTGLQSLHATGIVHRDMKPQNIIFSEDTGLFKIIDLGAAADLRVGINYQPKEFLLDPRYAAPEQYIMSTQTPSAPPPPVATALSPVLWQMNLPDRFDIYSTGLIFLQMAFPSLRSDSGLITFNRQLKRCEYDMAAWRELVEKRPSADMLKGFAIMDLNNGTGWELVQAMVRYKGRQRISASGALAHPYFTGGIEWLDRARLEATKFLRQDPPEAVMWILNGMAKSGTKKEGGFTEVQLYELRKKDKKERAQKSIYARSGLAAVAMRVQKKPPPVEETVDAMTVGDVQDPKKESWWNRWQSQSRSG